MRMSVLAFLKDRFFLLVLHLVCMGMMSVFLRLTGYSGANVAILLIFWGMIVCVWLVVTYLGRRKYFEETGHILEQVDKRYLLGELLPSSAKLEDRLYRDMIRRSNKSVIERIRQVETAEREYREYIENWVHEVKAPITGISLLCENGSRLSESRETLRAVSLENQKIENYVDMALYYARSEDVYKDYVIRETKLSEIAIVVLKRNKHYLIQNHMQAEVDCKEFAYTDQKWITFILNQLVLNSTKYRREHGALIRIYTEEYVQKASLVGDSQKANLEGEPRMMQTEGCLSKYSHGVRMVVEDNGIGIQEEELGRIFEKGFTGSNGRKTERSTGMGLYLCKKLCKKLGIEIYARSREGEGTEMILEFPVSSYLSKI